MKLLICTQVVDQNDPVLGFMHAWILECARQCESVEVICLKEGTHALPSNVRVHSLGKEKGSSRISRVVRLFSLAVTLRSRYEGVLVHMNPEYVVALGILWRCMGKQIGMWYAHGAVDRKLRLATQCTHHVFTSTQEGFRIPSPKTHIVGQGIDSALFAYTSHPFAHPLRLTTVGRISRVKHIENLIVAAQLLVTNGTQAVFTIVGVPLTDDDRVYTRELEALVAQLGIEKNVVWKGPLPNTQLPAHLHASDIFIHAGETGSLDKALLESLSAGVPTISCNVAYPQIVGVYASRITYSGHPQELAQKVDDLCRLSEHERRRMQEDLRQSIETKHSIQGLISRILAHYSPTVLLATK